MVDDHLKYSLVAKPLSGAGAALGLGKKVIGGFVWMEINFARDYFGYRRVITSLHQTSISGFYFFIFIFNL